MNNVNTLSNLGIYILNNQNNNNNNNDNNK